MSAETTAPDPGDWLEHNRANWDERVPIHVDGRFYDLAGFVAGRETLTAFELSEVGDVRGKRLLHLQSHIGTETLGWARHGSVHGWYRKTGDYDGTIKALLEAGGSES